MRSLFAMLGIKPRKIDYEDFEKFAKTASEKDLDRYCKAITEGAEIDFTNSGWGHAFNYIRTYGKLVQFGTGHYGSMWGSKPLTEGSVLLLKTSSGKIGRYLVLSCRFERDPRDMYWAYIVCIGYKENLN